MPVPSPYDGLPVFGSDEGANLTTITQAIADALAGRTVRRFASISAMQASVASLPSGSRAGAVAFVDGKGWWGYDGSIYRKFPMPGYDYVSGHANTSTNGVGLFSIDHTLGVAALDAQLTHIYGGPAGAAEDVMNRIKLSVREFQMNRVVCFAADVLSGGGGPVANAGIIVGYRFEKFPS